MGVPYETKPEAGVVVPGGQTKTLLLDFPARSLVSKIVVVQTAGTFDDFTVELFNHRDALEGTADSDSSSDSESGLRVPLDCYRVGGPKTGTGGKLLYFSDDATGGAGLMFYCQDPPKADRQGQIPRNLYVRISPAGAGDKTFAIVVGGESLVGG